MAKKITDAMVEELMRKINDLFDYATRLKLLNQSITQTKAFQRFGRVNVTRWRLSGKINPVKKGNRIFYSLDELIKLNNTTEQ